MSNPQERKAHAVDEGHRGEDEIHDAEGNRRTIVIIGKNAGNKMMSRKRRIELLFVAIRYINLTTQEQKRSVAREQACKALDVDLLRQSFENEAHKDCSNWLRFESKSHGRQARE